LYIPFRLGSPYEAFITLSYEEVVDDHESLSADFRKFWKKFKYRYPDCEYLAVAELQKKGAGTYMY